MSEPLLRLIKVNKVYPGQADDVAVLKDIELEVKERETLAIVGPSGSGKSTLLNLIGTLDDPTSGQVLLEGTDATSLSEEERSVLRNRKVGFIFQLHHLLPQCTVLENVLIPTLVRSEQPRSENPEPRARRLLERVSLSHRLDYRPGQLSGGERQRVAVVRALINEPRLLLADEPTGSLDHTSAENLVQLLVELNREEGVSIILVTHAVDVASRMDRKLELRDGTLRNITTSR